MMDEINDPMNQPLNQSISDVYTDLALEAHQAHRQLISGVQHQEWVNEDVKITKIKVVDEQAAAQLGKPIGTYITIEAPDLREQRADTQQHVQTILQAQLNELMTALSPQAITKVLVVGLGNDHVTPDSLGPKAVEKIRVTRHLIELNVNEGSTEYANVSAIAPGVLGTTGIETSEMIRGLVQHVQPHIVIAIDALAARSLERLHTTIQMADSGIFPGSGIGNKRKALNQQTLGVPVIAIGIPTVVYAATIVQNCIDKDGQSMSEQDRLSVIDHVLAPHGRNLIVTPKETDSFIREMAHVIASAINHSLHLT